MNEHPCDDQHGEAARYCVWRAPGLVRDQLLSRRNREVIVVSLRCWCPRRRWDV